jgi:hypothetical protein
MQTPSDAPLGAAAGPNELSNAFPEGVQDTSIRFIDEDQGVDVPPFSPDGGGSWPPPRQQRSLWYEDRAAEFSKETPENRNRRSSA